MNNIHLNKELQKSLRILLISGMINMKLGLIAGTRYHYKEKR